MHTKVFADRVAKIMIFCHQTFAWMYCKASVDKICNSLKSVCRFVCLTAATFFLILSFSTKSLMVPPWRNTVNMMTAWNILMIGYRRPLRLILVWLS